MSKLSEFEEQCYHDLPKTSNGVDYTFDTEKFSDLILNECLKIIADKGSFEAGSVDAFNEIALVFGIEADYHEFAASDE
jgi:hypothetical protein